MKSNKFKILKYLKLSLIMDVQVDSSLVNHPIDLIFLVFDAAKNSKSSSPVNPASCWTRVLLELPLVVLVGCVVALDSSSFVPAGVFWNHGQSSTG